MRATPILLGLLLAACSSSPTGNTPPPPPPPVTVASVTLNTATASVVQGQTATLMATARDAGGTAIAGKSFTWQSSNAAIASVSGGVVTGVAPGGPVTITATSEGKSATAQVTVTAAPVQVVEVTPTSASLQVGGTQALTAVTKIQGGAVVTGRTVAWNSSNPAIASVSDAGVVTAVSAGGPVTVTATSEGKTGSAQITVTPPPFAAFAPSTELQISNGTPMHAPVHGMSVAPNGAAVGITGTQVFDRSTDGVWVSAGTAISGTPALIAAHADPAGGLWATGSNGVIVRKVGNAWVPENTGSNAAAFNAIAIRADGSGFAVGNPGGAIYQRSSAGTWSTVNVSVPAGTILTQVASPTPNFALAVGYVVGANNQGVSLRWNGTTWTSAPFPFAFGPSELIVVSPTEAYAVGMTGSDLLAARYTILQWNGSTWQVLFQRPVEVYPYPAGNALCSDGTIYFGYKYGHIYRKAPGGALTNFAANAEIASNSFDLICDADNSLVLTADDGYVGRYRNGTWTTERWLPNLNAVAIGSTNRILAAARMALAEWDGGQWKRTVIPQPNGSPVVIPVSVWASGQQAAVTGAPAGRFTNGAWSWGAPYNHVGSGGIWGPSADLLFAVGGIDEIDVFQNGAWTTHQITLPGLNTMDRISGAGNFALAYKIFDDEGYQWDGASWSAFPVAPGTSYGHVSVFSPTSIVSVGPGRTSLWNGTAWTPMPGGNAAPSGIVALIGRNPSDLYAFTGSTIYHYNGTAWVTAGTTGGTVRAAALLGNQAIAVGNNGLVLRATLP